MIGLSTTIFKSAGKKLVNLFGSLASRSTYVENVPDSLSEKNHIDDLGILDKASILLTPTATSNARLHSVKTYTGDELVTNGTFDADSDWDKGTGWSINGGTANCDGSTGNLIQNNLGSANKTYKLTFSILDYVSGYVRPSYVGLNSSSIDFSGNGTYSTYINSLSDLRFVFYGNSFNGSIDNVSVTEADADFDFDRASSATRINSSGLVQDMQSITDPELVLNGDFEELGDDLVTNGDFATDSDWNNNVGNDWQIVNGKLILTTTSYNNINQGIGLVQNKFYKIVFTIANTTLGGVRVRLGTGTITSEYTNGTHTIYLEQTTTNDAFRFYASSSGVFDGSIDNVSVQQVDPNDRWILGTGWSIEDGKATQDGSGSGSSLQHPNVLVVGNTYKIVFDIVERTQGSIEVFAGFPNSNVPIKNTVGTHTLYLQSEGNTNLYFRPSNFIGSIDNISVKDVTFSTDVDLARINYDSNGDNGHILLEPTSTNLITYSEDFSEWDLGSNATLTYESDVVAPDGSLGVYRLTLPAQSGTFIYFPISNSNQRTCSVYAKSASVNDEGFNILLNLGSSKFFTNNEWQRFEFTDSGSGNVSFINSGDTFVTDIYIWGAQLEELPYATSYIPNHGTAVGVTRATETLNGSGNSTLINSTEGVLYAEIAGLVDADAMDRIISLSDNTTTNRVEMKISNSGSIKGRFDSASSDITLSEAGVTASNFNKIALVWSSGKCGLFINGVKEQEDLTFSTFSSDVLFDLSFKSPYNDADGSRDFYGKVKALAVFNEALEDDELELLTGVTNYGSFSELASANGYTII